MNKSFSIIITSENEYSEVVSYLKLQGFKVNESWCKSILQAYSKDNTILDPLFLTLNEEWENNEFELFSINYVDNTYTLEEYIEQFPLPLSVYEKDKYLIGDLVVSQVPGERIVMIIGGIDTNLNTVSASVVHTSSPSHPIGQYLPRVTTKSIRKYYGEIKLKSKIRNV